MVALRDIFDEVAEELDIFNEVQSSEESSVENLKSQLTTILAGFDDKNRKREHAKLKADFEKTLKEEIAKIKPVQNVIEKTIEKTIEKKIYEPLHIEPKIFKSPPQIIKEVRIEVEKTDLKPYAEKKSVAELESKIEELNKKIQSVIETLPFIGGSGVIGLPNPEGNAGKTLQVVNNQWKPVTAASGGGSSSDAYTPTNVTTDRSFDATNTSLDELANNLGSLIASLQGAGIIQ